MTGGRDREDKENETELEGGCQLLADLWAQIRVHMEKPTVILILYSWDTGDADKRF